MSVKNAPLLFVSILALMLLAAAGCKRTRDSFTSRTYHRMVSKFNPLFNGEQAYLKGMETLRKAHKDNFDEILDVYVIPTEKEAGGLKPDMDKAIEKGAKVIQEHSMLIKNNQKNSYIDDSYLLVAKARFYKRDFIEALETFNFVIQEFEKKKSEDEARVWAAKSLIETENYLSAKGNVEKVYRRKKAKKRIKVEALSVFAQIEIRQKNYEAAIQLLSQAADKTKNRQEEIRWLFIVGQLHSKLGNNLEASEKFKEVIKKGPPYELLFQAQLNRAKNYDVDLQNPNKVFDELRAMLRDDKNYDNRDQIYFVMAEVAERLDDDAKVEEFLGKSIRVSTTNNAQKGLSYLKFGEINFDNRMYPVAAAYYDSAYAALPNDHKRYEEVGLKKKSLSALVENIEIIETQDSLQRIGAMTEKQRIAFVDKVIKNLEKKDREAAEAKENAFNNTGFPTTASASSESDGGAGSFYFYNQNLRSSGVRDFKNRFGNRKLEDNWRREDKQMDKAFDFDAQNDEGALAGNTEGSDEQEGSKYKREDFLKNVPVSDSALAASNKMIVDAYVALGRIYKEDLKDFRAASKELEKLLRRYPDLDIKGRIWYTLYRVYTLGEDTGGANKYKNLILSEMPESEYAELIRNEGKPKQEVDKSAAKLLYVSAYEAYEGKNYKSALTLATEGVNKYSESTYGARFFLLRAYALAKSPEREKLGLALRAVIDRYPNTGEAEAANRVLAQIDEPIVSTEKADKKEEDEGLYSYDVTAQHRYILIVPNVGVDMNNLRNDVSDFTTNFFKLERLNTRAIFLDENNQMIIVTTLSNADKALNFYNTMVNQKVLVKYLPVQETKHFVISNDNFQKFYKTKNVEEYMQFFNKQYLKKNK